jgi:hypothetical protein
MTDVQEVVPVVTKDEVISVVSDNTNPSNGVQETQLSLDSERKTYEVVLFSRWYNRDRPSENEITDLFTNFGKVHHVSLPKTRTNVAFVFMESVNTDVTRARVRSVINMIRQYGKDKLAENDQFFVDVARPRRRSYGQYNQYNQNYYGGGYNRYHHGHQGHYGYNRNQYGHPRRYVRRPYNNQYNQFNHFNHQGQQDQTYQNNTNVPNNQEQNQYNTSRVSRFPRGGNSNGEQRGRQPRYRRYQHHHENSQQEQQSGDGNSYRQRPQRQERQRRTTNVQ